MTVRLIDQTRPLAGHLDAPGEALSPAERGEQRYVIVPGGAIEEGLDAAVHPGTVAVAIARVEEPSQVTEAEDGLARWSRIRGVRAGAIALDLLIESARGVTAAAALVAASTTGARARVLRPERLAVALDCAESDEGAAMHYAAGECWLTSMGLVPVQALAPASPSREPSQEALREEVAAQ